MIDVTAAPREIRVVQPLNALYEEYQVAFANGVVQISNEPPFQVLISNLRKQAHYLAKNQVVGTVLTHPTALIHIKVSATGMLGLTPTSEDTPQSKDGESGYSVSQQVNDKNDSEMKAVTSIYGKLEPVKELLTLNLGHVPDSHRKKMRDMLRELTSMWNGSAGEVSATEHFIDLMPGVRPIAQQPYWAGPTAREKKQL